MKNKQIKQIKNRKSMKNRWGKVGAPPKSLNFPRGAFTMESLFNMNKGSCELTVRNKVTARVKTGELIQLKSRKQKGGSVGRPSAVFVLKDNFDKEKHEKADAKVKTPKTRTVVAVSVEPVVPTVAPEMLTEPAAGSIEPMAPAQQAVVSEAVPATDTVIG